MTPAGRPAPVATWAALIVVYLVWGSTYLGIRVLVGFVPPLLAMGVRFLCAGILLAAFLAVRHGPGILRAPPRRVPSPRGPGGPPPAPRDRGGRRRPATPPPPPAA